MNDDPSQWRALEVELRGSLEHGSDQLLRGSVGLTWLTTRASDPSRLPLSIGARVNAWMRRPLASPRQDATSSHTGLDLRAGDGWRPIDQRTSGARRLRWHESLSITGFNLLSDGAARCISSSR
ncbi:MAG: hypothetical protein KBI14_34175 [Kofleriaceae bacterium]|nr:hypothetical protein [Kofleriaceae bacterium]MBP9861055.1 hypothetical protein [Kofleriaceae bacterium]